MQNPKLAQIQLGHKDIKTTYTHYTGPNEKDKQQIDVILNHHRVVDPAGIAEDLSRRYINNELPEEDYLYAMRSLRKAKTMRLNNQDPAFQ